MLISTGPYRNTPSMPVHQVYPPVLLILLLSTGQSHTTSPLEMAGRAGSQLPHNLQCFHGNCFHSFKLLCPSLPSFPSLRLHNSIYVFVQHQPSTATPEPQLLLLKRRHWMMASWDTGNTLGVKIVVAFSLTHTQTLGGHVERKWEALSKI